MLLPDRPPDLHFEPVPRSEDGLNLFVTVKKAALGPHSARQWVWDDAQQKEMAWHESQVRTCLQVQRGKDFIGVVALKRTEDCIILDEFYLLPEHHNQGIGTRILRHCIAVCSELGLPIRLRYMKWNPVASLYERHGFVRIGETEFHWLVERPVQATGIKL